MRRRFVRADRQSDFCRASCCSSFRTGPTRSGCGRPSGLDAIRKIFSFSAYQFLFNAINYFSRNLDKLLIGKYMGMTPLGYYEKSYRLMMLPLQNITHVISRSCIRYFQSSSTICSGCARRMEKIVRLLAFIGFPLSVFLWFAAQEVVLIIFGSQWMPSVPVFRILSLSVGVQIVLASSGGIFQAANDTRSLFCQRGVFGDAQRGWHSGRDFRFSIVGGGRMVHLCDVYDQFRAVLLDDVPGDVREKPPVGGSADDSFRRWR